MTTRRRFADRAAVVGIGQTALSRASGRTVLDQAGEAVHAALADAGMDVAEVDGLLTYQLGDSVPAALLAKTLGLASWRWHDDIAGGGTQCASVLVDAAMVIDAGLADVVVVVRAMNGRSGKRMGQSTPVGVDDPDAEFLRPYGLLGPVTSFALAARRYLHDHGRTAADFGRVAIQLRANAAANERAVMREPITLDDYFASPFVAEPLRRLDCCQETDGACAAVLTAPGRARGSGRGVLVRGGVRAGGLGCATMDRAPDVSAAFSRFTAAPLREATGVTARDVDVALLYDAFTYFVLAQLEDLGFCQRGGAGELVAGGGIAPDGDVPVNPHGGLLSEGYVHGMNNVLEAVRQLRGEGVNQVVGAEVALCTGFGGDRGSAVVLVRQD